MAASTRTVVRYRPAAPHGGGKGADQMALGDAQPLAELLHAVQAGVVCADILNGGLHQRRQGGGGAVGPGQLAQQGKGQLAAGPAVGGVSSARRPISSAAAGQVSPRARKGSSGSPARNCTPPAR